jgi:hypothetical protein
MKDLLQILEDVWWKQDVEASHQPIINTKVCPGDYAVPFIKYD